MDTVVICTHSLQDMQYLIKNTEVIVLLSENLTSNLHEVPVLYMCFTVFYDCFRSVLTTEFQFAKHLHTKTPPSRQVIHHTVPLSEHHNISYVYHRILISVAF